MEDNEGHDSPDAAAKFWRDKYNALDTQPFMRLPATGILAGVCSIKIF